MSKDPNVDIIERKNPSSSELNDPNVWILDVGGIFDPHIKAFDHHQKDWNECTISLLLKEWGLRDSAIEALPWLEPSVLIDSEGLIAMSHKYEVDHKLIYKFQSPIEEIILDLLSQTSIITPNEYIFPVLRNIGNCIMSKIRDYEKLKKLIKNKALVSEKKGVPIIVFLESEPSKILSSVIHKYKQQLFQDRKGGLSIIKDNRNENALRLFRFDNDQRVDLKRLNGVYPIKFLHKKEFLSVIDLPNSTDIHNFIKNVVDTVII